MLNDSDFVPKSQCQVIFGTFRLNNSLDSTDTPRIVKFSLSDSDHFPVKSKSYQNTISFFFEVVGIAASYVDDVSTFGYFHAPSMLHYFVLEFDF